MSDYVVHANNYLLHEVGIAQPYVILIKERADPPVMTIHSLLEKPRKAQPSSLLAVPRSYDRIQETPGSDCKNKQLGMVCSNQTLFFPKLVIERDTEISYRSDSYEAGFIALIDQCSRSWYLCPQHCRAVHGSQALSHPQHGGAS